MSDDANAPSLVVLLSASVLRGRDEPPGSSLLCSEGAGSVDVGGRSGREEEGRSEQQGPRDSADAPSLVLLLLASVLRGRDEPPGSSLLTIGRAERDREEDGVGGRGGRKEEGRGWQQSTRDSADAPSLVLCSPPLFFVCATSLRARRC